MLRLWEVKRDLRKSSFSQPVKFLKGVVSKESGEESGRRKWRRGGIVVSASDF